MAIIECISYGLLAFGPSTATFILTVLTNPVYLIVFYVSAFFWLLSLLLSAAVWFVVIPLRTHFVFALVISVILQEASRIALHELLRRAQKGLQIMCQVESPKSKSSVFPPVALALITGQGFALTYGAFVMINSLMDMLRGPGTIGIYGIEANDFYLISALQTMIGMLLQMCWGIIVFSSLHRRSYYQSGIVCAIHMGLAILSCTNKYVDNRIMPRVNVCVSVLALVGCAAWAFLEVGGQLTKLKSIKWASTIGEVVNVPAGYNAVGTSEDQGDIAVPLAPGPSSSSSSGKVI